MQILAPSKKLAFSLKKKIARAASFVVSVVKTIEKSSVGRRLLIHYKTTHHHVAHRPHSYLMEKSKHYAWWHSWQVGRFHHGHVHWAATASGVMAMVVLVGNSLGSVSALNTWNQTDWSGGVGSSTTNQYASASNLDFASGSFSITSDHPLATGGTITDIDDGGVDYRVHSFTTSDTLSVTGIGDVEYLVVGGGGGGGGTNGGGGGGAGGMLTGSGMELTETIYPITVGGGGTGGTQSAASSSGSNSVFNSITATGGGGGGGGGGTVQTGSNGGSGGGSTRATAAGTGTSGQGNNGGGSVNTSEWGTGGGGGKGAVGASGTTTVNGAGGIGAQSSITGTATYYAGGGGGGRTHISGNTIGGTGAGAGGNGGGGSGGATIGSSGQNGTANTGGGGGGGTGGNGAIGQANGAGGAGGSGIVIVRYPIGTEKIGTLTSSILDAGELGAAWGTLNYVSSGTGSVEVKARSSNSSDMTGAPAFAGCAVVISGDDLTNESCVSDTHRYIQYQVTMVVGNGESSVFENISIDHTPYDITPPDDNATNITMKKATGGASVVSNDWTNGNSPYFEWNAGSDTGTGIKGYCLYLGTDETADPVTAKGLLGTSPLDTDGSCQFAISTAYIDTAASGYLGTALTSSNSSYYLNIKAIDNNNNVYDGDSEQFQFRFDNTPSSNPAYITAPSQFVANKEVTLTWPTAGGDAASDSHSGLVGLQYRIGSGGTWYGDDHTGDEDVNDILANDGSYTTINNPDFANINEGNNVVYFRSWDTAGNVSSVYTTTVIKLNTSSPSSPQNVTATPATNTTNSFAFSWAAPNTYQGSASNLTYCYTINTTPNVNTCTFTAAGVTNLPAGAYATQPGENTFYVVAKDEAGNINYATAASETFNANTSAPGLPLDLEIADVSTKATSSWKLALSWSTPDDTGAGIASYLVYRSTDNSSFSQIASTAGTSYVDGGLSQNLYYYKVKACDSANNCGAFGATVSKLPTGRYTSAAGMTAAPKVSGVSTRKATIRWSTDRASDSKVSIGTKSGTYDPFQISSDTQTTDHEIKLSNLTAGTTYFAKASWTDEDGNTGLSSEFSFKTEPAPSTQDVEVTRTNLSSAQIRFTSTAATRVQLQYGKSTGFGGEKEISTSLSKSTYDIELNGLDDGTKYSFRLNTFDADGNEYEGSTILNFTTPARPRISNLRYQPLEGEPTSTQQVSWNTNVPATSLLRYSPAGSATSEIIDSKLVTDHQIVVSGLLDDTSYSLLAESRDASGNLAVSDTQTLKTALDTRAPKITNVKVETNVRGNGAEAKGQVVVSWKTDEPATSQVAYGQGSGLKNFNNRSTEDVRLTTEHIVIISDLSTSKVYTVQPVSKDKANNTSSGNTKSAIIGKASDSVISIVLNTLRGVFGF